MVARWKISRLHAVGREGRETGTAAALHAFNDWWRCVRLHQFAQGRGRSEVVAGREADRVHQLVESGRPGETGKEKAEGRGAEEGQFAGALALSVTGERGCGEESRKRQRPRDRREGRHS